MASQVDWADLSAQAPGNDSAHETEKRVSMALVNQAAALLCDPSQSAAKWSKPDQALKRDAHSSAAPNNIPVVLITGFEPDGGSSRNASWEAASRLNGQTINGATVIARELPVSYEGVGDALARAIKETNPTLVVLVGEGPLESIHIEKIATNSELRDGRPVVPAGPRNYSSTLPVAETVQALKASGIKADQSEDAGTFICNKAFYLLENYIAKEAPSLRGGFVHVPLLPDDEMVMRKPAARAKITMPLQSDVDALKIVIATGLKDQLNGSARGVAETQNNHHA